MKIQHRCCKNLYFARGLFNVRDEDEIYIEISGVKMWDVEFCPFCGVKLKLDIPRKGRLLKDIKKSDMDIVPDEKGNYSFCPYCKQTNDGSCGQIMYCCGQTIVDYNHCEMCGTKWRDIEETKLIKRQIIR